MHSDKRKVVVQIVDSIYRGGVQKVALEIVKNLPQYEHVVCYWTDEDDLEEEFVNAGAKLIKIPFNGIVSFLKTYFFLRKLFKTYRPNIVHAHMFVPNLLMRLLPKNFKTISTYHGEVLDMPGFKGSIYRALERTTLNRTDVLIAVSEHVRDYIKTKLKTSKPIEVIHNFAQSSSPRSIVTSSVPLRLISTSNNQPYKDYPLLIEALAHFSTTEVTLDVFGSGMEPLMAAVEQSGISNITFHGSVADVSSLMKDYSAFIIASKSSEGFSLSLVEAMASGMPIVCSDIPQFLEAVGDSAFVFRRSDVQSLVNCLTDILRNPSKLSDNASKSLQRSKLFSQDVFVRKMRELYER